MRPAPASVRRSRPRTLLTAGLGAFTLPAAPAAAHGDRDRIRQLAATRDWEIRADEQAGEDGAVLAELQNAQDMTRADETSVEDVDQSSATASMTDTAEPDSEPGLGPPGASGHRRHWLH